MQKLLNGLVEFREQRLPQYAERFRELAQQGQFPDTLFVTCSDSRVVPDLLLSTDPGDLFVIRNVGNLIPPAQVDGASIGDLSEASAMEYALLVLNVRNIVVCGHSECGAMRAVLARSTPPNTPNLSKWLHYAMTSYFRLEHEGPLDRALSPHNQLSQLNVLVQIEHLLTYPLVRDRVHEAALQLSGWWFDIATGEMSAYESTCRSFVPIDRAKAEQLSQRLLADGKTERK